MIENRYAAMTTEDFNRILEDLIYRDGVGIILMVPGVYELLAEEYNNAVLELWEEEQELTEEDT